jgi:hypothetical protein
VFYGPPTHAYFTRGEPGRDVVPVPPAGLHGVDLGVGVTQREEPGSERLDVTRVEPVAVLSSAEPTRTSAVGTRLDARATMDGLGSTPATCAPVARACSRATPGP